MTNRANDYLRILELPPDATVEDIRFRHRQLVRVFHPDRYSDPNDKEFVEAMMKRVNEAYNGLMHGAQSPITQSTRFNPAPTVYRTVKGVPPGMTLMLAVVSFVLGIITVQFTTLFPFSKSLANNIPGNSAIARANAVPLFINVRATATDTPTATATTEPAPTSNAASKTPIGEPLVMSANGMSGAFPVSSRDKGDTTPAQETLTDSTKTDSTKASEQSAAVVAPQPTHTPLPTSTATATASSTPTNTTSPIPTDTPLPTHTSSPTDTPAPTHTATPTFTALPTDTSTPTHSVEPTYTSEPTATAITLPPTEAPQPPPPSTQPTEGGILLTISVDYNVFARSTTSIQSEPVALLAIGQQVLVVGRTIDNYWLRIRLADGRLAWVYSETIGIDFNTIASLPVVNQ